MKGVFVDHKWCSNAMRGPRRSCLFTRPCPFKHTPTRHAPQSSMRMLHRILNGEVGYRKTYSLTMRQEKSLARQGTIYIYILPTYKIKQLYMYNYVYIYLHHIRCTYPHISLNNSKSVRLRWNPPPISVSVWPKIRPQAIMECLSKETSWTGAIFMLHPRSFLFGIIWYLGIKWKSISTFGT